MIVKHTKTHLAAAKRGTEVAYRSKAVFALGRYLMPGKVSVCLIGSAKLNAAQKLLAEYRVKLVRWHKSPAAQLADQHTRRKHTARGKWVPVLNKNDVFAVFSNSSLGYLTDSVKK